MAAVSKHHKKRNESVKTQELSPPKPTVASASKPAQPARIWELSDDVDMVEWSVSDSEADF